MLSLGNKIIAGSFKAGASWEVGDVGISAFGIDEALNKRRYLNGQVISQAQFVQFTAMLKSRVSVYPNLATTEVNWQAEVTNSALGQCGKFVIDDVAGTIRLPKVVNINGLQDLTGLGGIKAESLPNISGKVTGTYVWTTGRASGAFEFENGMLVGGTGTGTTSKNVKLNASLSSSTYQDGAPVQQEAVQYPYFIQVAEGVETSVDVSREIELNNPFSLLDYKYSEYELSNASWLLSNGQWNSGTVYQSVYDLLLQIYNGTVTKAGVSVKLSTETYADTDFVLNTDDTTFRLPTKVFGIETSANGLYLYFYVGETVQDANVIAAAGVLTDVADLKAHSIVETYVNGTSWYRVYSDGWCEQGGLLSGVGGDNITVNFIKPLLSTEFSIKLTKTAVPGNSTTYGTCVNSWTTTSMLIGIYAGNGCFWEVSGYIS